MRAKSLNYNQRAVPAKNQFKMSKKEKIKKQCIFQNKLFQQWDQKQNWQIFHNSHYDWWAFPIDRSSGSYGSAYKVEVQDLNFLIQDKEFIQALKSNARLVCKSWGWNLQEGLFIKNPNKNQRWQRWPIRLSKMCRSLEIFGQVHPDVYLLFENAIKYGIKLLKEYKKFTYGGQDLTQYFIEKNNLIEQKNQNKKQSKRTERKEQKQKAESFENGYTIRSKIQGDI